MSTKHEGRPKKAEENPECQRARFSLCCRLLTLVSFKVSVLMLQIEKDIKQRFRAANQMLCQFSQCWIATTQHFPAFPSAELKKKIFFCSFLFWLLFYLMQFTTWGVNIAHDISECHSSWNLLKTENIWNTDCSREHPKLWRINILETKTIRKILVTCRETCL